MIPGNWSFGRSVSFGYQCRAAGGAGGVRPCRRIRRRYTVQAKRGGTNWKPADVRCHGQGRCPVGHIRDCGSMSMNVPHLQCEIRRAMFYRACPRLRRASARAITLRAYSPLGMEPTGVPDTITLQAARIMYSISIWDGSLAWINSAHVQVIGIRLACHETGCRSLGILRVKRLDWCRMPPGARRCPYFPRVGSAVHGVCKFASDL